MILKILLVGLILTTVLSISLEVSPKEVKNEMKNVKLIINGLLVTLLVGPIVGIILANVFNIPQDAYVALIIYLSLAGAPLGPKIVHSANGDTKHAITFLLFINMAVIFVAPILLNLLIPGEINVPIFDIIKMLLVLIVLPLVVGMTINIKKEQFAQKLAPKMVKLSSLLLMIFLVSVLVINIDQLITIDLKIYVVYILTTILTMVISYWLIIGNQSEKMTIMYTGLTKNTGVAIAILGKIYASNPELMPITNVIVLGLLGLIFGMLSAKLIFNK